MKPILKKIIGSFGVCGLMICFAACGETPNQENVKAYPTSQQTGMNSNLASGLPQQFAPTSSRYPMTGSKPLKIVHRTNCALVDSIKSNNREYFRAFRPAQEQGYEPCHSCRPDQP